MDLKIRGKKALITGADSGIGWHSAQELLNEGVTVFVTDRDASSLARSAAALEAPEGQVFHHAADITRREEITELGEAVQEEIGDIDILIHAAGITGAQGLFHEIDDEGWVDTLSTDLLGAVRITREFLPALRRGQWGRLIFLASEDAVQPYDDELPYCASKAGVLALSKGLSRTYAREGLLVNAVSPAFIHTPMTDAMMDKRSAQLGVDREQAIRSFLDEERPHLALKRRGEPEEVAAAIVFLCSDRASFVTGSNYRVDGGSVATV